MSTFQITHSCGHTEEWKLPGIPEDDPILQELSQQDCNLCSTNGQIVRKMLTYACGHTEEREFAANREWVIVAQACPTCCNWVVQLEHDLLYEATFAKEWSELEGDEAEVTQACAILAKRVKQLAEEYNNILGSFLLRLVPPWSPYPRPEWVASRDSLLETVRSRFLDFDRACDTLLDPYLREQLWDWLLDTRRASVFIETQKERLGEMIFHPEYGWLRTDEDIERMFETLHRIIVDAPMRKIPG